MKCRRVRRNLYCTVFACRKVTSCHSPALSPRIVSRPWGQFEVIAAGDNFCVKIVTVNPGCSISLQSHRWRSEHWTVISGSAYIECDSVQQLLVPTEAYTIPAHAKHRLTNPGETALQIVEVQSGSYIGEDDIQRFEDDYGRVVFEKATAE